MTKAQRIAARRNGLKAELRLLIRIYERIEQQARWVREELHRLKGER